MWGASGSKFSISVWCGVVEPKISLDEGSEERAAESYNLGLINFGPAGALATGHPAKLARTQMLAQSLPEKRSPGQLGDVGADFPKLAINLGFGVFSGQWI